MVIQRLQSLLLLAATIVMGIALFTSPGYWMSAGETLSIKMAGIYSDATGECLLSTWYLLVVAILAVIVPFIAIFMYKNLRRQLMLCGVAILMTVATWGLTFILGMRGVDDMSPSWQWPIILPAFAIVLEMWAQRRIIKDRRLLESVDRLR